MHVPLWTAHIHMNTNSANWIWRLLIMLIIKKRCWRETSWGHCGMLEKGSRKLTLYTHINFQRIIIILKEKRKTHMKWLQTEKPGKTSSLEKPTHLDAVRSWKSTPPTIRDIVLTAWCTHKGAELSASRKSRLGSCLGKAVPRSGVQKCKLGLKTES